MNIKPAYYILAATAVANAVPSLGAPELKIGVEPTPGMERTVSVGSPIAERYKYYSSRAIVAEADLKAANYNVPAGTPMQAVPSSAKFKACLLYQGALSATCAIDDDGDGAFDRMPDGLRKGKLDPPVRYLEKDVIDEKLGNFRQMIVYMGTTADTLRLSYREFSNDMARPAFTEELSLPLGKSFPQRVAVKNNIITILAVDGMGMRYRIEP